MCEMASLCLSEDTEYQDIRNPQRAVELLKRAIRHGSGEACFLMGNLYHWGEILPKNDKKAFENWKRAVELNDYANASNLAYAYMEGIGCDIDREKGLDLYKKAVENGDGFAAHRLFIIYSEGQYNVKKDDERAKYYLQKAADLDEPYGCYNLGLKYYKGDGFAENDTQAFIYVKKAADMGLVVACDLLAYFYEKGIGVDRDPKKSKEYKDKTIANDNNE